MGPQADTDRTGTDSFTKGTNRANPARLREMAEALRAPRAFPPAISPREIATELERAADALEYVEPLADAQLTRLVDFLFERIEDEDLLGAIGDLERACKRALRERDRLEQTVNCMLAEQGQPPVEIVEYHRGMEWGAARGARS